MSATEYARYVLWGHRGCLVRTTEDAQNPTCVTTVRRLYVEHMFYTLGLGAGGAHVYSPRIKFQQE